MKNQKVGILQFAFNYAINHQSEGDEARHANNRTITTQRVKRVKRLSNRAVLIPDNMSGKALQKHINNITVNPQLF